MKKTYFTTHTRYGAWMIGILLGYLLHNIKGKNVTLTRYFVVFGWSICCLSMFAIIFAAYPIYQVDIPSTLLEISLQESLSRVTWSMCLAWIIFACVTGYGGPVDWFLSLPHWQPLSKLSYSLYIVHFPFQMLLASLTKNPVYFSDFDMVSKTTLSQNYFLNETNFFLDSSILGWFCAGTNVCCCMVISIWIAHCNPWKTHFWLWSKTIYKISRNNNHKWTTQSIGKSSPTHFFSEGHHMPRWRVITAKLYQNLWAKRLHHLKLCFRQTVYVWTLQNLRKWRKIV